MKQTWNGSLAMAAAVWRLDRRRCLVALVLMIGAAVAAPLQAAGLAWMTEAFVAHRSGQAELAGLAVAAASIVALTFSHFAHIAYFELAELAELDFDQQVILASNGSTGIGHHLRAEQADELTVLQQQAKQFTAGLEALLTAAGLALAMALTGFLLVRTSPVLLLLPLAAIAPLLANRSAERVIEREKTITAAPTRTALKLFRLVTSPSSSGELRVFGLEREIPARHAALWRQVAGRLDRAGRRAVLIRLSGQSVFAAAYIGTVLLVAFEAVHGRRGVGGVVLALALAGQVSQQIATAMSVARDLQRSAWAYRRLADYRAAVEPAAPAAPRPAGVVPDRLREGIRLEGVGFRYPDAAAPALHGVDLRLPAGATVAVVGENGAGKSTLVSLLCGFHRPTEGRILVDGIDLADLPAPRWRERIAAGFQDFVRFEFPLQRAVGVGDLAHLDSADAALAALDRAGAAELAPSLDQGLDTQLGTSYAEGAQLSGGQWQKVALGRAMMRTSTLLLVLDEPTSALDPETEHTLIRRSIEHARRVRADSGAITVLISHRFSTVRAADLIVVLRDGAVAEVGDHDALIAADGLYAELFALQSAAYR
jgi:ATP-binding cassette subfamily B protein